MKRTPIFLLLFILLIHSCTPPVGVFEKNISIPDHEWSSSFKPEISFEIKDTAALYRLYVVLRHTDAYGFKNIWLNVGVQSPGGDKIYSNRINLLLASDEKGWLGKGMDDVFEHRASLENAPRNFPKPGIYKFTLQQIMREDPLDHVMNAGIRLEKVAQ